MHYCTLLPDISGFFSNSLTLCFKVKANQKFTIKICLCIWSWSYQVKLSRTDKRLPVGRLHAVRALSGQMECVVLWLPARRSPIKTRQEYLRRETLEVYQASKQLPLPDDQICHDGATEKVHLCYKGWCPNMELVLWRSPYSWLSVLLLSKVVWGRWLLLKNLKFTLVVKKKTTTKKHHSIKRHWKQQTDKTIAVEGVQLTSRRGLPATYTKQNLN